MSENNTAPAAPAAVPEGGAPAVAEVKMAENGGAAPAAPEGGAPSIKPPVTALSDDGKAPAAPAAPASFPDNWREEIAKSAGGTDQAAVDKELKRLKMFSSPSDVFKSMRELESKFSKGEFKTPLPESPTPEQLADYRKANGIPETPDKYEIKLNNGLVLGEQERPMLDAFKKEMHDLNAPPAIVNAAVNRFMETQTGIAGQTAERYDKAKTDTEAVLQKDWGGEYQKNINITDAGVRAVFGSQADAVLHAIGGDGRPLFSNPDVVKAFNMLARQTNPMATLDLPSGMDNRQAIESRVSELKKMMGVDGSDYWKKPELQEEYRNLVRAQEGMKKKA